MTVHEGGDIALRPGTGRERMRFSVDRRNGRISVVPADAVRPLREDRVDPRLFDVTTLLDFGYGDRTEGLPLIVDGAAPAARAARRLPGGMTAVDADPAGTTWTALVGGERQRAAAVTKVWLDGVMRPSLDVSVPQIGAPAAWQAGLDGKGVTVAVLDTGVDDTHPDLAGRVTAKQNFVEDEDARDLVGHGTHVASTVAGTGASSGGRYRGVAPGASLLDGKVCGRLGCAESWILAGMQWAAEQGADVVNMSLGGFDSPGLDPLEQAVQDLTAAHGTLFVIAAGNEGLERGVGSPATADAALAVGAVDRSDQLADFSNRGPRPEDAAIKPEITAPGVDIVAARSKDGDIAFPAPLPGYTTISGTSMATPHVAGAAAILAQQHDDWGPERLKAALVGSAKPHPELPVSAQGGGRVDVARATAQAVTATPATLNLGFQAWPHQDDEVRTAVLTYRNDGSADLDLDLAATGPAGLVTLSAPRLRVPAGGEAAVTVTVDTRGDLPDAFLGGAVTATAGELRVRTPLAVEREVESYDVDLTLIGRDGAAPAEYRVWFLDKGRRDGHVSWTGQPSVIRLPKGEYALAAEIYEAGGAETTFAAQGQLIIDGEHRKVTVDARGGEPVSVTVPKQGAEPQSVWISAVGPWFGQGIGGSDFTGLFTKNLGPRTELPDYATYLKATFGQRGADGTFEGTPYLYSTFYLEPGTMVTGFRRTARQSDFAEVKADHAVQAGVDLIGKGSFADHEVLHGDFSWVFEYPPGVGRTEYYNADHGVRWAPFLHELVPQDGYTVAVSEQYATPAAYRPGSRVTETWNRGVFGPSFPPLPEPLIGRVGDYLYALPAMFGDGAGREGTSALTGMTIRLFRDGEPVGTVDDVYGEWRVPAERATYRLEVTAQRGAPHRLSTTVAASWTFTSQAGDPRALPLSAVIFSPPVDGANVAPKGRAFAVPLRVQAQSGPAARVTSVEVSYDDGATWSAAPVRHGAVQLRHPDRAGFVSLRATGGGVTQTVIRAYEIR